MSFEKCPKCLGRGTIKSGAMAIINCNDCDGTGVKTECLEVYANPLATTELKFQSVGETIKRRGRPKKENANNVAE